MEPKSDCFYSIVFHRTWDFFVHSLLFLLVYWVINAVKEILFPQVQDKFRLDLNDEEAVQYLQSLIDESVSAMLPVVVEQFHKMAQVSQCYIILL